MLLQLAAVFVRLPSDSQAAEWVSSASIPNISTPDESIGPRQGEHGQNRREEARLFNLPAPIRASSLHQASVSFLIAPSEPR